MIRPALVLAHGAGSNRNAPVLVKLDTAFTAIGYDVERIDLAFRQRRKHGPPSPAGALQDQDSIAAALGPFRKQSDQVYAGGHSYGGRMASVLASRDKNLVRGLLLLSYPLHPPGKPGTLRTAHFPYLDVPCLFVHGTRDPFGRIEEMQEALRLIPAGTRLMPVEGAGHDLRSLDAAAVAAEFREFMHEFDT